MLEILISNSLNENWVQREVEEFNEAGITQLNEMLRYWLDHFQGNNYPYEKFYDFRTNFENTVKQLGY